MTTPQSTVEKSSLFGPLLPDETIWSYYARFLSRFPSLNLTTLAGLLGNEIPSHRKTFPTRLANLAAAFNFQGAPDVAALVNGHTFWPFAQPEISAADADLLKKTMASNAHPVGAPDSLLLPAEFKLRLCPLCDRDPRMGFPYWHRCHQVPNLRLCVVHKTPLVETDIVAGTQEPVAATKAVAGAPLEVVDLKAQEAIAAAYLFLADADLRVNADQVEGEFTRVLQRHGYFASRQVLQGLSEVLRQSFRPETLESIRLKEHKVGPRDWLTVPKVALVLAALGESFHEFMTRAGQSRPPVKWADRRHAATERERELAGRVSELAPCAVAAIKAVFPFRRVTRWSLAKELNKYLGRSFAGNWSYRGAIKEALDRHTENAHCYANRVIEAIVENPDVFERYEFFAESMGAFGLANFMRRNPDMAREIRAIFKEVHAQDSVGV